MVSIDSLNIPEILDMSSRILQYSSQSSDSEESEAYFRISNLNPGDFEVSIDPQKTESILSDLFLTIEGVPQSLTLTYDLKKDVIYPTGIYTGQFKGGRRHGMGIFQIATGQKYRGTWADDCPTGKGRLTINNEEYYEGEFFKGRFFGRGVYKSSLYEYTGEWFNDKQDGHGYEKILFPDQLEVVEEYQGSFRNGLRHGQGTLTLISGDNKNVFDASFVAGRMTTAYLRLKGIDIQGIVVNDELRPLYIELHEKNIKIEFENVSDFQGKVYFDDDSFIYFKLDERSIESISLLNDPDN